ncbi:class I SAM-dependent methyltransferase [Candidatus Falkowbacteria bacterium]|nr:class I SAM-dependent methyltransferase [Candidatus Falkowbacteria bacterium]
MRSLRKMIMFFFIILLTISTAAVLAYFIFMLDSLFMGNDLSTSPPARKKIIELIAKHAPFAESLYDLGCGRGDFAIKINGELPRLKIIAIDDNRLRVAIAKFKKRLHGSRANFKKENIFDAKLEDADIVYTYLPNARMPRLEEKLLAELKSKAVVITNSTYFPLWRPIEMVYLDDDKQKSAPIFVYIKS